MGRLGFRILKFDSLPSTNDLARERAVAGFEEGEAVLARSQSAGRGRPGRTWSSPLDQGLYLSIILRPDIEAARAGIITLAAAVAVAETLKEDFSAAARIKWPNDVLLGGRKACGILTESSVASDRLEYAILGIGVNLTRREFPPEISETATSLLLATGQSVTPDQFLPPLLARLESWYRIALATPHSVVLRWEESSEMARDARVKVTSGESVIEGVTRGLAPSGALLVELSSGRVVEVAAGETTVSG